MMHLIDFNAFTWQAFATLATGVLAVSGALLVAFRQMRLQRQIAYDSLAIQKRSIEVNELTFREKLLDRRLSIYFALEKYMEAATESEGAVDADTKSAIQRLAPVSLFVFPGHVVALIDQIFSTIENLETAKAESHTEECARLHQEIERLAPKFVNAIGVEMALSEWTDVTLTEQGVKMVVDSQGVPH